jgi:hypothetical protein
VTATNFTVTLDYSSKTNPPSVKLNWPPDGAILTGSEFVCTGLVSDPTASVVVQLADSSGDTNSFDARVGRDGDFYAQHLPLHIGTNYLTITATDAANNMTTTNLTVSQGHLALTVDPVVAGQTTVTGKIGSKDWAVFVNGVEATIKEDGTWTAKIPPITGGGMIQTMAVPKSGPAAGGKDQPITPPSK